MKTPLALAIAAIFSSAWAADTVSQIDGDTVVISGTRLKAPAADQPVNLTVITRTDLDHSTASTVAEALASVAGVGFRRLYGEGAAIDLRGFGVSGSSNTRILLDGISLNDNDLSSPNLRGIPLDAVERIEIIKGGAVAWGGGTTGGVINIVTRQGAAALSSHVSAKLGNQRNEEIAAGLQHRAADWGFQLNARHASDDGDRDNSRETNRSVLADLSYRIDSTRLALALGHDQQDNRLPGSRTVNPITGQDDFHRYPSGTATPNDWANTSSNRAVFRTEGKGPAIDWSVDISHRSKTTTGFFDDYLSTTKSQYASADRREGKEDRVSPRFSLDYQVFGVAQELNAGVDWSDAHSTQLTKSGPAAASDATAFRWNSESQLKTRAIWLDHGTTISTGTRLTVGIRKEHSDQQVQYFGYDANYNKVRLSQNSNASPFAWQLGLRQGLADGLSLYAKAGRSFRVANADELVGSPDLKPQRSLDAEIGLEARDGGFRHRIAAYRMSLHDEIHYQAYVTDYGSYGYFGSNVNLDPSRRQGIELESAWRGDGVDISANLTYAQAEFVSGAYNGLSFAGKTVPLVPRWKANIKAGYQLSGADRVDATLRMVGKRYLDNDQLNAAPELAGFGVLDVKYSHRVGALQLDIVAQNIGNQLYADYGARSTGRINATTLNTRYNVYPESGRQWWVKGSYVF